MTSHPCDLCGRKTSQSQICPKCQRLTMAYYLGHEMAKILASPQASEDLKKILKGYADSLNAAQGKVTASE